MESEKDDAGRKLDVELTPGPSKINKIEKSIVDPVTYLQNKNKNRSEIDEKCKDEDGSGSHDDVVTMNDHQLELHSKTSSSPSVITQQNLERRLNIEEEVTFVSSFK